MTTFTRVLAARYPSIVYNPPAVPAVDYLAAAWHAGALPVLDSELLTDDRVLAAAAELDARGVVFGVRLAAGGKLLGRLVAADPGGLDALVLTYRRPSELAAAADLPQGRFRRLVEVRDLGMDEPLEAVDPHAVVVRGNEAPGRVSHTSAFVLMQGYLAAGRWPVVVHGGVGRYTAAGLFAAGASGIVLDDQLYLCAEAPLSPVFRKLVANLEEKDTVVLGANRADACFRVFGRLGTRVVQDLKRRESATTDDPEGDTLQQELAARCTALDAADADAGQSLFYLGQDAVFARRFAPAGERLDAVLEDFFAAAGRRLADVDDHDPLRPDSPLARLHGTRYPILQGPMANVSDNGAFARAVYEAGALPFFAMGSLPPDLSEKMLAEGRPQVERCGAGLIGIAALNQGLDAHLEQVRRHRVPFAVLAGGRPAQVRALEADGIRTYLHTPASAMLENAIEGGCRRFVLEGGEAGGHVGSLSSLVLWELAVARLADQDDATLAGQTLVFAGGIGTAAGADCVSGLAAHLARRGARIGIQVGSAYLFTEEIVATGAIKPLYQEVVCRERRTLLMGLTVGLAARTVPSPFSRRIVAEEHRRLREGLSLKDRKEAFERDSIGALLIGAKAFCPDFERLGTAAGEACLNRYDDEGQYRRGNFMVGDGLVFDERPVRLADLHARLMDGRAGRSRRLDRMEIAFGPDGRLNDEVAVVGMGCVLPGAADPSALWERVLARYDAIGPVPAHRCDPELYHDPDPKAPDKSYSRIAGTVDDFVFDAERFGYPPEKAARLSRSQQMILTVAYQAMADAGLLDADGRVPGPLRNRTSVVVGTCLGNELSNDLHLKYALPEIEGHLEAIPAFRALSDEARGRLTAALREGLGLGLAYEPVHGIALNMEAARIAHHLGAAGRSYAVDAACATSLAAVDCAARELLTGACDLAVVGGINTNLAPEPFVGFAKMGALSAEGSFPFDARADGFVLGEGAAVVVLKRFRDAVRDGDRIRGVIRAVGSGSDGRGKAVAAPSGKGQAMTIERCFAAARRPLDPADVGFIEAHGTGTRMGDVVEVDTLKKIYGGRTRTGISSIKSQIGHLLGGAGMAGLVKALLALEHRTLPPNGTFATLSPKLDLEGTGLFVVDRPRPWEAADGRSRLAAVSAYGFGGINYHLVVAAGEGHAPPLARRIFADAPADPDDRRVVVAGVGVVLPGATDSESFWRRLEEGTPRLGPIPPERFDNRRYAAEPAQSGFHLPPVQVGTVEGYRFDNARYRIPPAAARFVDRAQQFALDAAGQAIDQAGLDGQLVFGNRVAVILGTLSGENYVENVLRTRIPALQRLLAGSGAADAPTLAAVAEALGERLRERYRPNTEDTIPGLLSNIVSARVSKHFGCNGPNFTVDASCASATFAVDLAVRGLRTGEYDAVVTGGVDCNLLPGTLLAFKRLGLLSDGDCRIFDHEARGYVMSEGAAALVLTTLGHARRHGMPVLAELAAVGTAGSAPAHLLSPSDGAYVEAMRDGYAQIPVTPGDVRHLDVFGVANPFFDAVEAQAIARVFRRPLGFGNIKPEFGYFKGANAAVALVKLVMMAARRRLLPHRSHRDATTVLEPGAVLVPRGETEVLAADAPVHLAANVNGIGGNHGHTVVATLPARLERVADAARTTPAAVDPPAADWHRVDDGLVVLLPGQGAQFPGMMADIYRQEPAVRDLFDRGERIFQARRDASLLEIMFGDKSGEALNRTANTQPAVFLASAALHRLMAERGLAPDYFVGHSVGEFTALFCAGMLDFDAAITLVLHRAELMQTAAERHPGRIMVVLADAMAAAGHIRAAAAADVWVTNKNSGRQTAVSGTREGIDRLCAHLREKNVTHKLLPLSGAFHTPLFAEAARGLQAYLQGVDFAPVDFTRVVSNVTARPYPQDAAAVKRLLTAQIVSPVEFVASVEGTHGAGGRTYLEVGPGRLLVNLMKHIPLEGAQTLVGIDPKAGQAAYLEKTLARLTGEGRIRAATAAAVARPATPDSPAAPTGDAREMTTPSAPSPPLPEGSEEGLAAFVAANPERVQRLLAAEYERHRRERAREALERFDFSTERVVIAGAAVGLPGTGNKVFNDHNFDKLLRGTNFIDPLTRDEKERILDMNITRVFKEADGSARFVNIDRAEDVIQLAGKLGYFNLKSEYGIDFDYDVTIALAVAAGIEALKDAQIPLVMQHRTASTGARIPDGYALPEEMQATTGVILTSLFPGFETLIDQMNNYYYNKFYVKPYKDLEKIYYHLMESVRDPEIKEQITDWFFKIKERRKRYGHYKFNRNLLFDVVPLGSAHFAQLVRAKGPNMQMSGACASTTQAVGVAEDWIRTGRCERVIIIGGEAATSPVQSPWIASGFLAMGAASVKSVVEEAAKPFDAERNGTILGSGAVGMVVERADRVAERGLAGQAEVLGTCIGNSAFHGTRIDVDHVAGEMERFVRRVERRWDLRPEEYAPHLVFMSHETFTPARGGSAEAEIEALRRAFPDHHREVTITNTKGYTGHTLGAAIEDAVLVKALQHRRVPPIANLRKVPAAFADLKFSAGDTGDYRYGIHFSAGFGSHFALLFLKRLEERAAADNPAYQRWLRRIGGGDAPNLAVVNNTLCLEAEATPSEAPVEVAGRLSAAPDVEAAPTPAASPGAAAVAAAEPAPAADGAAIVAAVQGMVAEQTGYPVEMLAPDLDLEADLGIDTVKQVEMFGRISRHFALPVPEDLRLADLNTIARIADHVAAETGGARAAGETVAGEHASLPAAADNASVVAAVQGIIAEQTGYPVEMLAPDLDLEADLGIDTVKQVEMFGRISRHFALSVPEDLRLADLNTIARLAGYIAAAAAGPNAAPPGADPGIASEPVADANGPAEAPEEIAAGEPEEAVLRFEVRPVALPEVRPARHDGVEGCKLLVTRGRHPVGGEIVAGLRRAGATVVTFGPGVSCDYAGDFLDPQTTAEEIARVLADHPDLDGLVHLLPLDGCLADAVDGACGVDAAVRTLFAAVQRLQPRLAEGGLVAALSVNSVVWAYGAPEGPLFPEMAGMAGLLKSVAKEIPAARVKVVDAAVADPARDLSRAARHLVAELAGGDGRVEVGYRDGRRYGLSLVEAPAAAGTSMVRDGDVVLVTGGARGITFEAIRALAAGRRLELVVWGRSELAKEDDEIAAAVDEASLVALLRRRMPSARPLEIKQAAGKIWSARRSRDNLEALRRTGARVVYRAVDVADAGAVRRAVSDLERVDGLIHGAGLEESQVLAKKTLASFDRVLAAKAGGLRHLLEALEDRPLRWVVGFSSVTARFGNEGQTDYTAANDLLGRLIQQMARRHPERRCKVMAWTAWEGAGMATRETVRRVLAERGLAFLPLERGVRFFLDELADEGPLEAVFTGRDLRFDRDGLLAPPAPFIDAQVSREKARAVFARTLEMARDRFLDDHTREGVPLFLGATGIEAMAEAAAALDGAGRVPVTLTGFHIPYGIKLLKGRSKRIDIESVRDGADAFRCAISSRFVDRQGKVQGEAKEHFRGRFRFAADWPAAPSVTFPDLPRPAAAEDVQSLLYHPRRLFMDGLFRTVTAVDGFDGRRLAVRVRHPAPREFFAGETAPTFLTDVQLVDAMFQTGGMLEVLSSGDIVLPYEIERMTWYGAPRRGPVYRCLTEKTGGDEKTGTYRLTLVDEADRAVIVVEGFTMVKVDRLRAEDRIDDRLLGDVRKAS